MAEIRDRLGGLSHSEMQRLATIAQVPFTTLWKIRDGTTKNPGVETVRQFYPHIGNAKAPDSQPAALT